MKLMKELLERKQQVLQDDVEETVTISGRVVSIRQKPFVEKDIVSARKVLHRLLSASSIQESNEVSEGDITVETVVTVSREV